MANLFQDVKLETVTGEQVEAKTTFSGKAVALYFSSHWCPDCVDFAPALTDFYKKVNESGKNLEIVFVSSDESETKMVEYMKEMQGDWLRVPYDSPLREELKKKFQVFAGKEQTKWPEVERKAGIPSLVVLKPESGESFLGGLEDGQKQVEAADPAAVKSWPLH
eukprot:TRINITY_DN102843_c0_g1_i1.p1 TRINITY_DN102843_c0_g1~~TRINITY_DN102843_c0_g1_i1.p1  ORF type:complete len:164 (-),score=46.72 TRINITY_DN102843_c0_g1_i1:39-530(-)